MYIKVFSLQLCLLFVAPQIFAQNNFEQLFSEMSPTRSILNAIGDSHARPMDELNPSQIGTALSPKEIQFATVETEKILLGGVPIALPETKHQLYWKSEDQTIQIAVLSFHTEEETNTFRSEMGRILGMVTSTNGRYGTVYINSKTTQPSAVGMRLQHQYDKIISIEIQLPFAIPESAPDLPTEDFQVVIQKLKLLKDVAQAFAQVYVRENELIYFPSFEESMNESQRLLGLAKFWTEVKYNFAFFDQVPDLDWEAQLYKYIPLVQATKSDAEYYRLLERLCASLQDGHTNIYPPDHLKSNLDRPAVQLKYIEGYAVITNVDEKLAEQLPIGSRILMVDGESTISYAKREIMPYISSSTEHILYDWSTARRRSRQHSSGRHYSTR
ncbi:MAG: hypothetical protein AAGI23_23315 [Bacteroidota bacterium]